jgi:FAD/FMN-containing dehydrogenase
VPAVDDRRITRRTLFRRGAATALGAAVLTRAAAAAGALGGPSEAEWSQLRQALSGHLVRPGDPLYGAARTVYDLRWDGAAPAAIAYCASNADVQRAVDFGRRHRLAPIPRSGGHSYGGYSTGSGLIIDVSPLARVEVAGRTATVGAGTRLVDLYSGVASAGVLVPGGSCPTVGVAGLALGGGNGVLGRRYGLTADAIESLTIVTADGSVFDADPSHHADLHWASQGGGGRNFGVVTSFRFRAEPIPPLALFTLEFPWAAAGDLLVAWADWIHRAPDELWSNLQLLSAGPSGLIARATGVYVGSVAALAGQLATLVRGVGAAPTADFTGADTYLRAMLVEAGCADITLAQCHLTGPGSAGTLSRAAFAVKSAYLGAAPPSHGIAAFTDAVETFQRELPDLGGALVFDSYGGAINAVPPAATAFVHRDALCQLEISGSWGAASSATTVAAVQSWLEHTAGAIAPFTNGHAYQNYIDPTLADWQIAYYGSNLPRLERVKRAYDPDDVFSFRQSIPPAPPGR